MGILDYLNQKVDDVKGMYAGAVNTAKNTASDAKDVAAKALMPPRQGWIKKQGESRFETNKYKSDQYMYPMDLMTPQYGGNYTIFYINISDASRLKLTEESFTLDPKTEPRMRGSLVGQAEQLAGHIQSGLGKINDVLGKTGVAEKVGTIDIEAVKTAVPFNARSQRRLKTAIALHVPNQLSVTYRTSWGTQDTAATQAVLTGANAVSEALASNGASVKKNLSDVGGVAAEAAFSMGLGKMPQGTSSALGLAANPKKEQTFEGVEFRKFTFDYQFYPRDEMEAENVLNIIHQFKLHMHPEFKSELNYVWIYPSEFDITYYTGNAENPNLHKHTSCVLENMTINYTPNGNFSVFANGMPTQINMTLEFMELQLASKETIGLKPGVGL